MAAAVEEVRSSTVLVVASPTYKGTYTGLHKLFLERFERNSLAGVVAIPLMLVASSEHALAGELHLRPLLSELGASSPTPAVWALEGDFDNSGAWPQLPVVRSNLVSGAGVQESGLR